MLALLLACAAHAPPGAPPDDETPAAGPRLVAVGDVHGDLAATRAALRLAGVIDEADRWSGGDTTLVQVGDQLDRGDDEREILDWFEHLRAEAAEAGGAFVPLLGNHEVMNAQLDLRYVTDGGFDDFADLDDPDDRGLDAWPAAQRGRVAAFRPGGPYARVLAEHDVVAVVGGTVLVHGGVAPWLVDRGLDAVNADTRAWLRGDAEQPALLDRDDGPVWSRTYSEDTGAEGCAQAAEVLDALGLDRMVVAHTVQDQGINAACDDRVWRVDVGLAAYYGGQPEVLEIVGDRVRIIDR